MSNIVYMPNRPKTVHFTDMQAILSYHCELSFSIPRQYHSELSEYIISYWSAEYLMQRIRKNALELERQGRTYSIVFVNTDLVKLIDLAQNNPTAQIALSFRRVLPCYEVQNHVLIKCIPEARGHGY